MIHFGEYTMPPARRRPLVAVLLACAASIADAGAALDAARAAAAGKKGSVKGPSAADRARAAQARATGSTPTPDAPRAATGSKPTPYAPRAAAPITGKRSAAGEIAAAKAAAAKARAAAAKAPPPPTPEAAAPPPPKAPEEPTAAKSPPAAGEEAKTGFLGGLLTKATQKEELTPPVQKEQPSPPPALATTATMTVRPPAEETVAPPPVPATPQARKGVETSASVYKRLEAANTTQLLDLVLKVPLRSFELAHDSRTGRRQLGSLGEDLEYFMPEAVNVGRRAFPDPDNPRVPIYVENFAHVDSTVLFMHSLGATQELARRQEVAEAALVTLTDAAQRTRQRLSVVQAAAAAEQLAADAERNYTLTERAEAARLEERRVQAEDLAERDAVERRGRRENETLAGIDEAMRKRIEDADAKMRQRQVRSLELEEETVKHAEGLRRATDEALARRKLEDELAIEALRAKAEQARAVAAERAKAEMERLNEDVRLRAMRARADEARRRLLAAIALAFDYIARGAMTLLGEDPRMLAQLVGAVIACVAGAYFSREFAILARNLAEAYFGRPRLVRETSRVRAARLRDLAAFVFRKTVKVPLDLAVGRARFLGEEGLLVGRVLATSAGNGSRTLGAVLRDGGRALLAALAAIWLCLVNAALALAGLITLAAFAVSAKMRVLWRQVALPRDAAAAKLAAFDLKAELTGVAAFKRKDAAKLRLQRRKKADAVRDAAAQKRRARHAARHAARDRRAAQAAASRASARERVRDARHARVEAIEDALVRRETDFLDEVVLPPGLRERLVRLATATRNAKQNHSPFRHMLLHGPPGTGKTLCAKRLAKATGLEYALMSGGDVGPLGPEGVTALHALFRWARTSTRGVLVFIDEAEAFLASRANGRLTEHMRNALNAFLYQTGTQSPHFVLVLATNRASDLDEAVLDRTDEEIYVGLPDLPGRRTLVRLYYGIYLRRLAELSTSRLARMWRVIRRLPAPLKVEKGVDEEATFDKIADETRGFSGREIEKLFVAVQAVAYGSDGVLDLDTFLSVVQHKLAEHRNKALMNDSGDARPPSAVKAARSWITDAQAGLDHEDSPSRDTVKAPTTWQVKSGRKPAITTQPFEERPPSRGPSEKAEVVSVFLEDDEESLYGDEGVLGFESPEARLKSPAGPRFKSPARRPQSRETSPSGPPLSRDPLTPPPKAGSPPINLRSPRHTPVAKLSPFEAAIAKRREQMEEK